MPDRATRLALALNDANVGLWDWNVTTNEVTYSSAWKRQIGHGDGDIAPVFSEWHDRLHPDDRAEAIRVVDAFLANPIGRYEGEFRLRHKDGSYVWIRAQGSAELDANGTITHLLGTHVDITAHKQAEIMLGMQVKVLEMIASGVSLEAVLSAIATCCESESQGMLASILLLDADGKRVRHGAAPSLPAAYCQAIDGVPIGPRAGSCGTAAWRREPVIVDDIATDPLWADYAPLALAHGLRACWSTPILDEKQGVLGTFAMYYRHSGHPPEHDLRLVEMATSCAAIALGRHRSGVALRQSESRYQRLMEANLIGVMIAKIDGTVSEANDRLLDMIGATRDELASGRVRWDDITPPEWRPVDEEAISALRTSGIVLPFEKEYVHRDGHRVPIMVSVAVIDNANGDCLSLIVDLTKQKKAETDRAAVLARVADAVAAFDTGWRFTYLNAQTAQLVGRSVEQLIGRNVWEEFPDVIGTAFYKAFHKAMAEQVSTRAEDHYAPFDRWLEIHAHPSPTGLSVFIRDTTGRRNAEFALRSSEERYRVLVEHSGDVFFLAAPDRKLTFVSPSIRNFLDYDPDSLVGTDVVSLIHPDDARQLVPSFTVKIAGTGTRRAFRVRHRDGSWREVEGYGVSSRTGQAESAFVGIWHDVTDRNRADRLVRESAEQIRRLSQHLQEAREEEQGHIARELHDRLGQSLTMLKLGLARLVSRLPARNKALRDNGSQLMTEVDATIAATREIAMDIRPPLLDDLGLAAALEWAGQRFSDRSHVQCVVSVRVENVSPEAGRGIFAIASEAMTNVARHAAASRVTLSLDRVDDALQLDIADDGRGFDAAGGIELASLGIVGMRERAAAIGGIFEVRSVPGRGTTVTVRVPFDSRTESLS